MLSLAMLLAMVAAKKKMNPRKANDRAIDAFTAGEHDRAHSMLRDVVAQNPNFAAAWRSLAWIAYVSRRLDEVAGAQQIQERYVFEAGVASAIDSLCWSNNETTNVGSSLLTNIETELSALAPHSDAAQAWLSALARRGRGEADLCASYRRKYHGAQEVGNLHLGPLLCEHPAMHGSSGISSKGRDATDLYVDMVKRIVSGFVAGASGASCLSAPGYRQRCCQWDLDFLSSADPNDARWVSELQTRRERPPGRWDLKPTHDVPVGDGFPLHDGVSISHVGSLNGFSGAVRKACELGVSGDILEAGVFRGGAIAVAAAQLAVSGRVHGGECAKKRLWAADSFEGIPPVADPSDEVATWPHAAYASSVDALFGTFHGLGLSHAPVTTLRGRFNETLPTEARIKQLSVLRIDADTREGTLEALDAVYAQQGSHSALPALGTEYLLYSHSCLCGVFACIAHCALRIACGAGLRARRNWWLYHH